MCFYLFTVVVYINIFFFVFFKHKTAYEMHISDWSSDVCSSDLAGAAGPGAAVRQDHACALRRTLGDGLPAGRPPAGDREARPPAPVRPGQRAGGRDRRRAGRGLRWPGRLRRRGAASARSEEHTSELQSLMRISYAVFCLKKKKKNT